MPDPEPYRSLSPAIVSLTDALVESMVYPAVVVRGASEVVASNKSWALLLGRSVDSPTPHKFVLYESVFEGLGALIESIRSTASSDGSLPLVLTDADSRDGIEYVARWRRLGMVDGPGDTLALVLLEENEDVQQLTETVRTQSVRINELLVHQTVIEEEQRRLLGTSLHDHVSQILAHARRTLADEQRGAEKVTEAIALIDEAIVAVRDLTFALSPPILADLGLLPALRWLVDDLTRRFGMEASFVDDGKEPNLSLDMRTVAFRAIRELANNAVKHAPGSEVVLSSLVNHTMCRLTVRDSGPGFDREQIESHQNGRANYGLLSVEQQILALGGTFELVSVPGEGTRAVIKLPLVRGSVVVKPHSERADRA